MSYDFVDSLDWRWILVWVGALSLWFHHIRKAKNPPLPPDPRRLPFVGNILDIPSRDIWLAWLGDIWGDISSLTVFGQTMVIVNSLDVAEDLLDARGANFSDRPVIPMSGEMAGFNNVGALAQYGDRVRTERNFFHQLIGGHATTNQFMSLYPDVQTAAQDELDTVIGTDRLADSLVIPNIWKMLHDPERYANLMAFDPTRFLATSNEDAEMDPARICFGFGRRICPGKLLADTTLFLACSSILAVFNISKAREKGYAGEPFACTPHAACTTSRFRLAEGTSASL
ncbi:cytochrome P450 [Mycena vulgaris]|nr:cytochrome P450 [Mycena vulgaris]